MKERFSHCWARGDFAGKGRLAALFAHISAPVVGYFLPTAFFVVSRPDPTWLAMYLLNRRLRRAQRIVDRHDPTACHDRGDIYKGSDGAHHAH